MDVDFSKACDRMDWNFLINGLMKMGISRNILEVTMWCMKSVSYRALINGKQTDSFKPESGLRQGDPFPFNFL